MTRATAASRASPRAGPEIDDGRLATLRERLVRSLGGARVKLARPPDLLVRILDHLLPLRDPTDRARHREQHGEHRDREAHGAQDDARVEVDVRIELALDEIVVLERDPLEIDRQIQALILDAEPG